MLIFLNRILALILPNLSLPVIAVAAMIAFYEGVPVINDIPFVDRVPLIGDLVVGRVGRARLQGAEAEANAWQVRAMKQQAQWAADRRKAQAALETLAGQYLETEARTAMLEAQFQQEIHDADILCSGPVISLGLSRRLDAIGR